MGHIRQRAKHNKIDPFQQALADIESGKVRSIQAAAEKYGLRYETMRDRKRGAQPRSVAREDQQHLTKQEEEAIVRCITRIDNYGWPPRVEYVKQMALGFIRSHGM